MIVRRRLRPVISVVLHFYAVIQRRGSGSVVPPPFSPIRGQAPPAIPRRGSPASPPALVTSTIPLFATTIPVAAPATPARATRTFAFAACNTTGWRRATFPTFPAFPTFASLTSAALATFVAPDRGWWIFGPLDTKSRSFEVSSVHVIISVLRIPLAAELHKSVTAILIRREASLNERS